MGGRREDEGEPGTERPVQQEGETEVRNDDSDPVSGRGESEEATDDATKGTVGHGEGESLRPDREQAYSANAREDGGTDPEERGVSVGWVDESATRLLGAFHDLSEANPDEGVLVGEAGAEGRGGAAQEAGIDLDSVGGSVECGIAVRYLLNKGYVEKADEAEPARYKITASGIEQIRRARGLFVEPPAQESERGKMSEKTQARLLSILTIVLFVTFNRQVNKFIDRQIPERRGIRDDFLEASLQGVARLAAVFGASLVVRRLIGSRD